VSSASKHPAPFDPKPVKPVLQTGQASFGLSATPIFGLGFVAQPSNPVIFW
jgi:hypothetical protein